MIGTTFFSNFINCFSKPKCRKLQVCTSSFGGAGSCSKEWHYSFLVVLAASLWQPRAILLSSCFPGSQSVLAFIHLIIQFLPYIFNHNRGKSVALSSLSYFIELVTFLGICGGSASVVESAKWLGEIYTRRYLFSGPPMRFCPPNSAPKERWQGN